MQSSRERKGEREESEKEREKKMMENGMREWERDAGIFLAHGEKDASDAGC